MNDESQVVTYRDESVSRGNETPRHRYEVEKRKESRNLGREREREWWRVHIHTGSKINKAIYRLVGGCQSVGAS